MTLEERYKAILGRYLPASAVNPVFCFLNSHSVHFHISRRRSSKLGDYRMPQPRHQYHEISVNGDLSPHLFLLVLLHEMAHLNTFLAFGREVQAHGYEWQEEYRKLLTQYSNEGHFPAETKDLLAKYTSRIPLNHKAGEELERQLKQIDDPERASKELRLEDLPIGSLFRIMSRPQILFRSVEKRRTRYRCIDEKTGTPYLVNGSAVVVEMPKQ
ncbi:MAG: SprT-like domain-containing protein [Bacteroidales bacterium]|nr:SprT-like domain-containing protein [Bacteroidales bacterium]